jgi:hypothetical protein
MLIPFDVAEAICLKDAAARAGKGQTTVRNWCRDHHIGRRVGGGTWMVGQVALAMSWTVTARRCALIWREIARAKW